MSRIGSAGDAEVYQIIGSNFTFQGARLAHLGATEYTLVTIAVDVTGSTEPFAQKLREMLVAAINSCKKSPRSDNLLARVITFSTSFGKNGINELHGFKRLADIDPNNYPLFKPDGRTPLFDAAYSAIGAMVEYGSELMANDFLANGIVFVITDGADNESTATPSMIRGQIAKVTHDEKLESMVTVLVGINAMQYQAELEGFRREAGFTHYVDMGEVTPSKLAKLGGFISQSVSSQSQAIGTGGPSQNIVPII
ncbi:MAG: vWA domain-containing protein [Candidatus Spechtbacterales bacterium]